LEKETVLEATKKQPICNGPCQLPRLMDQVTYDDLTAIFNRRTILGNLEIEIKRSLRHRFSLSVLMIDLDNFKNANDTHGHLAGDKVLKLSSVRMQKSLRKEDFLGRYGGDEFLVILPHTDLKAAAVVANRLVLDFDATPILQSKDPIRQTISIGLSLVGEGDTVKSIVERCDHALYLAKKMGRNRFEGV